MKRLAIILAFIISCSNQVNDKDVYMLSNYSSVGQFDPELKPYFEDAKTYTDEVCDVHETKGVVFVDKFSDPSVPETVLGVAYGHTKVIEIREDRWRGMSDMFRLSLMIHEVIHIECDFHQHVGDTGNLISVFVYKPKSQKDLDDTWEVTKKLIRERK